MQRVGGTRRTGGLIEREAFSPTRPSEECKERRWARSAVLRHSMACRVVEPPVAGLRGDVPFEFVGEVARASALTEASHVEGGAAAARHDDYDRRGKGVVDDGTGG